MALKNNWNPLVDRESFVEVKPINDIANAVISLEEKATESADALTMVSNKANNTANRVSQQQGEINSLSNDISATNRSLEAIDQTVSRNDKRIANLEQGIPNEQFTTDSSVAYTKNVPSNALPYAEIEMVGGMIYKDGDTLTSAPVTEVESVGVNLLNPDWRKSETINGVTFAKNADGSVTANGTATGDVVYHMALNTTGGGDMLEPNTTYYASLGNGFVNTDNKVLAIGTTLSGKISYHVWANSLVFTTPAEFDSVLVRIRAYAGEVFSNEVLYPIIAKSSVAVPYSPYVKNTLAIPEAVQTLDGYGEGVSDSVYNYIDLEKKQFIKRIVKVVLNGSEAWGINGSGNYTYFSHRLGDFKLAVDGAGVCDKYENTPITSGTTANGFYVLNSNAQNASVLNVRDLAYTTTAEWKAHLAANPITVCYGLTTPIVTDLSDVLSDDNLIGVEGNGTVTMKNEHKLAVPSKITYMLKEA